MLNMPSYKLTYFNAKGLGEPIRFLFNYAGVEFVDERLTEEQWKKLKPTTPSGQVPILEVDGKVVNQSTAILRYLAKQFGLAGKDDWENLEIDATCDTIHDVRMKIVIAHYEALPEAKAQKTENAKELVPFYIERLEAQVKRNGGYFVGGKLTWVDIVFVANLDLMRAWYDQGIIESSPELKKLEEKVLALSRIKAYVEKRPKTDY